MRLSDIMGHMDLATYPMIALVLFLVIFAAVIVRLATTPREAHERHSRLALERDESEGERNHV